MCIVIARSVVLGVAIDNWPYIDDALSDAILTDDASSKTLSHRRSRSRIEDRFANGTHVIYARNW
jgi:hypothetical protein